MKRISWFFNNPYEINPIVVGVSASGEISMLDGFHRFAALLLMGEDSVRAFVDGFLDSEILSELGFDCL